MALSFAFFPDSGETPETLKKKRRIAEALIASQRAPQNVGEGLNSVGQAILYRIMSGQAERGEKGGLAKAASAFSRALGGGDFEAPKARTTASAGKKVEAEVDVSLGGADLSPHQRALLETIAGPESAGKYDVIYGGSRFSDFSDHPRKAVPISSGPNAGKTSSAAGKYQFLGSTWDEQARKLGLSDFSPASQDRAAWNLAQESYRNATGGDLDAVLRSGDPAAIAAVGKALNPIWTSLPGGIEEGTNTDRFVSAFSQNLAGGGDRVPPQPAPTSPSQGRQVASLDPAAGLPPVDPYANIPAVDGMGQDQRAKFRAWNSDPRGNEAANMASIDPALRGVVERAKQIAGTDFVMGSGRRDTDQQRVAVANGWSKTMDSDHLGGGAADLWPVDENGAVVFDPQKQAQIVAAMKQAAGELGIDMEAGADWKRFRDAPHFGMTNQTPLEGAPIPTARPSADQPVDIDQIASEAGPKAPRQTEEAADGMSDAEALSALGAQPNRGEAQIRMWQRVLAEPFASDEQKMMAQEEIQRIRQENDPLRQLQLEKAQMELDAARNPQPKYDFVTGRDGSIFRSDSRGNMEQVYGGKPELPADVQEYEYYAGRERQAGREPLGPLEYQQALRRSSASQTNVNVDQRAEGAFEKKSAEKQAEAFDAMATEGLNARADLGLIDELDGLLQGQGGIMSGVAGWLAQRGIGGEGMDDLQAAQALINKLVPTQRQPGSGSMSDRDVELFTRSLPSLWNKPQGNQKILNVMRGLAQYKASQGEIADQVLAGEMTRQEGRQALRGLENPLAEFRKTAPKSFDGAPTMRTTPPSAGVSRPATKEEYDALPPGTQFEAPDGSIRVKP